MRFPAVLSWSVALIRHVCALTYIREYAGANRGEGVEEMQRSTGNEPPAYWCMSFVYRAIRKMLGKILLRTASCSEQRVYAKKAGALRTREQFDERVREMGPLSVLGWVFLAIDRKAPDDGPGMPGHAHHTGFVGAVKDDDSIVTTPPTGDGFITAEGNAADPEKPASRDGNGAWKGRLRGNRKPTTYTFNKAREYATDGTTYEFIDPEAV